MQNLHYYVVILILFYMKSTPDIKQIVMSQKSSLWTLSTSKTRLAFTNKSSEFACRVLETIPEESDESCNQPPELPIDQPKYDPGELRDAAKILGPFLRLLEEPTNPYAWLVANELCKTYFRLLHPAVDQNDAIKTLEGKYETSWNHQLWAEFWQYTEDRDNLKPWTSIKDSLKYFEEICTPVPHSRRQQAIPPRQSSFLDDEQTIPTTRSSSSSEDVDCKDDGSGRHDSTKEIADDKLKAAECPVENNRAERQMFDYKQLFDNIAESKRELEWLAKAVCEMFLIIPMANDHEAVGNGPNRQTAGNDKMNTMSRKLLSEIEPYLLRTTGVENYNCNAQTRYYTMSANESSWPLLNQLKWTSEPDPAKSNATTDDVQNSDDDAKDDHADLVANAFANVSYAEQVLQKKKEAYQMLKSTYSEFIKDPVEMNQPCSMSPTAQQILRAIYDNPPRVLVPLHNSEQSRNAFRDPDFVRLLPFYESVLNQLECSSRKQREYGLNMLDDVLSVLYHIHYDLGDPRLKSDVLTEHVRLITRNTWESYFYRNGRSMPQIPPPVIPPHQCPAQQRSSGPWNPSQAMAVGPTLLPSLLASRNPTRNARSGPRSPAHIRTSGRGRLDVSKPLPEIKQPNATRIN